MQVGREQPTLRMLGLKLITACLDGMRSISVASPSAAAGGHSPGSPLGLGQTLGQTHGQTSFQHAQQHHSSASAVIHAVGDALGAFPLTPSVRIALVELMCCGTSWAEVRWGRPQARFEI